MRIHALSRLNSDLFLPIMPTFTFKIRYPNITENNISSSHLLSSHYIFSSSFSQTFQVSAYQQNSFSLKQSSTYVCLCMHICGFGFIGMYIQPLHLYP